LADADRILALTDLEDVRGNREIVDDVIANARKNYLDLMRRRKPLILADEEETRFQRIMDRLQARIGSSRDRLSPCIQSTLPFCRSRYFRIADQTPITIGNP
jgi:hypothetical protein